MKQIKPINLLSILFIIIIFASCSITQHPNEKIIIGKWRPVSVEKVVDSSIIQAQATLTGNSGQQQAVPGKTGGRGGAGGGGNASKQEMALDRLVQAEMRATLEIFPNKTAVKDYHGKTMHATWKMKSKGTKIVAKNVENKMKFVLEILEINKERIVVLEHAQIGDVKITYEKVF